MLKTKMKKQLQIYPRNGSFSYLFSLFIILLVIYTSIHYFWFWLQIINLLNFNQYIFNLYIHLN
jgi:uncharacterized protein YqhQ